MLAQGGRKVRLVQTQPAGERDQILFSQRLLVIEDVPGELPEAAFLRRGHRCFMGQRRLRMKGEREIAKLQPNR